MEETTIKTSLQHKRAIFKNTMTKQKILQERQILKSNIIVDYV